LIIVSASQTAPIQNPAMISLGQWVPSRSRAHPITAIKKAPMKRAKTRSSSESLTRHQSQTRKPYINIEMTACPESVETNASSAAQFVDMDLHMNLL